MAHLIGQVVTLLLLTYVSANSSDKACSVCACFKQEKKKIVDCYGMELTALPTGIPQDVEKLDLVGNFLEDFGYTNFFENDFPQLKELYLNNNPITRISPDAFSRAPNLSILLLHHIELEKLQNGTFRNLSNLKKLEMNNANIVTLDAEVFYDLTNIHELYLQENNIIDLNDLQFVNLTRLDTLHLELNEFDAPSCCELCGLTSKMDVRIQRMNHEQPQIECGCEGPVTCGDVTCFSESCEVFRFYSAAFSPSIPMILLSTISLAWMAIILIL